MSHVIEICGQNFHARGAFVRTARLEGEKFMFIDDPEPILEKLRRSRPRVDLFTFMQKAAETTPKYSYPMEWDNLAALPISTFDHWWKDQVDAKTRNMVRKAEKKGVETREVEFSEDLVRGIWSIYNETPVRQGKPFPHFGKDIEAVRWDVARQLDRSRFLGAYLGDRLIGFIKLVWNLDRCQAGLACIVSLIEHRDKAPTNALLAHAVRYCAAQQIPYLTYANFAYGLRQRDSLSDFKENNGFQRVDLPRYYVPLTAIGWAALQLGLHKKPLDRIPEPLIRRFREIRSSWHNRKLRRVGDRA